MKKNLIVIIVIAFFQNIYAQSFYEYDIELILLKSQETILNLGHLHSDVLIKNINLNKVSEEYSAFNTTDFRIDNVNELDFKAYLSYLNRKYRKKRVKFRNSNIKYKLGYIITESKDTLKGAIVKYSYILDIKKNNNKLKTTLYGNSILLIYEHENTYIAELKQQIIDRKSANINLEEQAKKYNLIDLILPIQQVEKVDSLLLECQNSINNYQKKIKTLENNLNQILGSNFADEAPTGFINSNNPTKTLITIGNSTSINDLFANLNMTENERLIMTVLFKEANKGLIINGTDVKNTLKPMSPDENIITLNGKVWLPNFAAFNILNSRNYEDNMGEAIHTDIWTVQKKGQVKINSITPNYSNTNPNQSGNSYFYAIIFPRYLQNLLLRTPSSYTISVTVDNPSNKTKWVEIPIGQLVNSIENNSHELQILSVYDIISRSGNQVKKNANGWVVKIKGRGKAELDLYAKCLNKGFAPPLKGKNVFADLNYIEPNINLGRENVHRGRAERDNIIEFNGSGFLFKITAPDIETAIKVIFKKNKNFILNRVNLDDINNLINGKTKEVRVSIKTPPYVQIPQEASKLINISITQKKDGTFILKGDIYLDKKFHQYIE